MPDSRSARQDSHENRNDVGATRRPWAKPTLVAYGPIGRLTQGTSGSKSDTGGRRP